MKDALVTAVIPTRNRPDLVVRAVKSALAQTYRNLEVVVVIDGPDTGTAEALSAMMEPRLLVLALTENVGGSEARNTGVRAAKGEWIAFLDDDDEWLPQKLSCQMAALPALNDKNVFLSSRYIERSSEQSRVYPSRLPDPGERLDTYLCCPRGFSTGGEILQTSTLVVTKKLMTAVPFVVGLKRGQDFMWLIQARGIGNAAFHVVPEVLSVFNAEGYTDQNRVSSKPNWRSFHDCVRVNRHIFTSSAYAYCIATRILTDVIKCREPFLVKLQLLGECMLHGYASPKCLLVFLYIWLIPQDLRSRLGAGLRTMTKRVAGRTSQAGTA